MPLDAPVTITDRPALPFALSKVIRQLLQEGDYPSRHASVPPATSQLPFARRAGTPAPLPVQFPNCCCELTTPVVRASVAAATSSVPSCSAGRDARPTRREARPTTSSTHQFLAVTNH